MAQSQPGLYITSSPNGETADLAPETRLRLRQLIDCLPDVPARLRVMGHALLDAGLTDLALECFGRALLADDLDDATHLGLVRTYLQKGNRNQAVAHLEIAISLRPEMRDLRVILAELLCNSRHLRRALDQLAQVLSDEPSHAGARRGLATILQACITRSANVTRENVLQATPIVPAQIAPGPVAPAAIRLVPMQTDPAPSGGVMVWQNHAASQIEVKKHNSPTRAWYWSEPAHPAIRS
ncbi:lipopolysaccharide assembly protein LapB [Thalassospira profundimaris]|uniref:tetratricopeptide repeat protein n=1 Tax=Thalassospira profundimaris TaxID=502049 RepID=UPI000DEDC5F5|nr:tetratricopeptide repeat protein [Thalassospira profundimaris]